MVIRNINELRAVVLWDDELKRGVSKVEREHSATVQSRVRTACPWASGPISRKARVLSLSNSLKLGISPTKREMSLVS